MDERNDITQMLEYVQSPGFCVQNQKITALNAAAEALLLEPGTDITGFLLTGKEEYTAFQSGCLYLTLSIGGKAHGATVTRIADTQIFFLEDGQQQAELRSMALAARELRKPMDNISSASSSTTSFTLESDSVPRRMWSITRPGVPMTRLARFSR